jgi:hypothetical protein
MARARPVSGAQPMSAANALAVANALGVSEAISLARDQLPGDCRVASLLAKIGFHTVKFFNRSDSDAAISKCLREKGDGGN